MDFEDIDERLAALRTSPFRARFSLSEADKNIINTKGIEAIKSHAMDFIESRLAPAIIKNDGKQTPYKGHPVFIAQHATATCCRGCLAKWHHIPKGFDLNKEQKLYISNVICTWLNRNL